LNKQVRTPHSWLFPLSLVLLLAASSLPGEWLLYLLLALGVAVFGLPHGSLDTAIAKRHLGLHSTLHTACFMTGYLGLGGLVVTIWWQAPTIALALFLLYSAAHFGDDVVERLGQRGRIGYGIWLLALPLALRPEDVIPVFEALGAMQSQHILAMAPWMLLPGGLLLATALWSRPQQRAMSDWRDPLLLAVAAFLLHPLAYFVAYFCFLHSPRHLELASRDLGLSGWREKLGAVMPATIATYCLILVAALILFSTGLTAEAALLRLVFITLAALTIPHMLLQMVAKTQSQNPSA